VVYFLLVGLLEGAELLVKLTIVVHFVMVKSHWYRDALLSWIIVCYKNWVDCCPQWSKG